MQSTSKRALRSVPVIAILLSAGNAAFFFFRISLLTRHESSLETFDNEAVVRLDKWIILVTISIKGNACIIPSLVEWFSNFFHVVV